MASVVDGDIEMLIKEASSYDFLRLVGCDIHGIQRGANVGRSHFANKIQHGIGVVDVHIGGGPKCEELTVYPSRSSRRDGNCQMKPVPGTLHPASWSGDGRYSVGQVICESYWKDGTPQQAHPRFVARKQLQRLQDMGYTLKSAWESEFGLFDLKTHKIAHNLSEEYSIINMKPYELHFQDLATHMQKVGINIEKFHLEWYGGCFEVNLPPVTGIKSADHMFIFKGGCKELFCDKGFIASFMPCPHGIPTGTMQLNHSVWNADGSNIFSDATAPNGMSQFAVWWTAGILKHLPALTILFCPTANCFRLLHTDDYAPHKADWGMDTRRAAIRVKTDPPLSTYIENRLPTSATNPYITLAATVAAGLDGIINKLELPSQLDPEATILPYTMEEALKLFEENKVITEALGSEFADWFLGAKKGIELEMFKTHNVRKVISKELLKEDDEYFVNI